MTEKSRNMRTTFGKFSICPKRSYFLSILLLTMTTALAQVERLEPPHWWVGFEDKVLQLMVKGPNISNFEVSIQDNKVRLLNTHVANSPNYLFLDFEIQEDVSPGTLEIKFQMDNELSFSVPYELKERQKAAAEYIGFSSRDVIYLITPDRFSNGDPSNDIDPTLQEKMINRDNDYARHGGDIRGMINHLDYIEEMGYTTLWPSPLLLNNMPRESYHGYAITDFYKVDPRFGSLEEYVELSQKAQARGIKLIMDQVNNHCGLAHWWMQDLPFSNWINYQQAFEEGRKITVTNHRRTVNQDIYASNSDRELMDNGWFVPSMPDLNQENPFLAQYLIQNSLWWIETLSLGGIRQDTYPYPDKDFMAQWAKRIMTEYPNFSIVGEEWSYNPLVVGYWQAGANNRDGYKSFLRCTMDFPMQQTLVDALKEEEDWNTGLIKLYEGLANDFYYASPKDMLLFGDNHDMDRLYTQLNHDDTLTRMALAFVLVAPRIPQIYYGTEILMENSRKPGDHGLIRTDFPGGWPEDSVNAFTGVGLDPKARKMQDFLRTLLNFRKSEAVLHEGATKHFAPNNGVYVLVRHSEDKKVLLILNKNDEAMTLSLDRFHELGISDSTLLNVITGEKIKIGKTIALKKGLLLLSN